MPDPETSSLRIRNLRISNFRGISSLSIRRLGRVTLLGGRNGVGKTTVLEAVRVYAARGGLRVLRESLDRREEVESSFDSDHGQINGPRFDSLFFGRSAAPGQSITIGPGSGEDHLRIEVATSRADPAEKQESLWGEDSTDEEFRFIKVAFGGGERLLTFLPSAHHLPSDVGWPRRRDILMRDRRRSENRDWPVLRCESLGPGLPTNTSLARMWDSVALTEEEDLSLEALRLVDDRVERIAVVADENSSPRMRFRRRVVIRLRDQRHPVPLKSLGDGATRLFAAALALANSRGGFLVVDEAENGIHYSVQRPFWHMLMRSACRYNVQVLATTHSKDCVRGFARAAAEISEAEGVYLRLERDGDSVRAVEYKDSELETAAEQDIEVR